MPRYYFDVYDGESAFDDRNGIDMQHHDIPNEAQKLLRLLAHAKKTDDKPFRLVADVRNEAGRVIYHASSELQRGGCDVLRSQDNHPSACPRAET